MVRRYTWLFLFILVVKIAHAEVSPPDLPPHANDRVLVTDWMDDDQKAAEYELLRELNKDKSARALKAIFITSGNTYLKQAALRQFLLGFGRPDIEVFAGTSIDLANGDPAVRFAADDERYGEPFLTSEERRRYQNYADVQGDGASQLARLLERYAESGKKLDVGLLTAPTDLVKAIEANPEVARKALGKIHSMGLWAVNTDGSLSPRFNPKVDPQSVARLFHFLEQGIGQLYTIPTSTVQNKSGLPYGYFPKELRSRIVRSLKGVPAFLKSFIASQIYRHAFLSSVGRREGQPALVEWVGNATQKPSDGAAFYAADGLAIKALDMTDAEIARGIASGQIIKRRVRATSDGKTVTYEHLNPDGSEGVLVYEFTSIDGRQFAEDYTAMKERAQRDKRIVPTPGFDPSTKRAAPPMPRELEKSHGEGDEALVMIFKNSTDDWAGLLRVLATGRGVKALAHGGIIVEAPNVVGRSDLDPVEDVADALRRVLQDAGYGHIKVAEGHRYSEKDSGINGVKGEVKAYAHGLGTKAFNELARNPARRLTAGQLFDETVAWSKTHGGGRRIDVINLGSGKDLLDRRSNKELTRALRRVMSMASIRFKGDKIELARNSLLGQSPDPAHPFDHLKGWDELASEGIRVDIVPTFAYGTTLVFAGNLSNNFAFGRLKRAPKGSYLAAVGKHGTNWSTSWRQAFAPDDKFDPNLKPGQEETSFLAVGMSDAWAMSGPDEYSAPDAQVLHGLTLMEYLNAPMTFRAHLEHPERVDAMWNNRVHIINAKGGSKVEAVVSRLDAAVDFLERRWKAQQFDSKNPGAPRVAGIFDPAGFGIARQLPGPAPQKQLEHRCTYDGLAVPWPVMTGAITIGTISAVGVTRASAR